MNTYEIFLVCHFCGVEAPLGTIAAETRNDAREIAAVRWPDARYEEMVPRKVVEAPAPREKSPVEQFL
jgi:hypothetical protein